VRGAFDLERADNRAMRERANNVVAILVAPFAPASTRGSEDVEDTNAMDERKDLGFGLRHERVREGAAEPGAGSGASHSG
jgi:hypothetical protein